MPRPRRHLPPGARDYVLSCAEGAALSETKIARALGMTFKTWRRILKDDPDARALWDEALAIERDTVVQKLYERAQEGDVAAARFLLGSRHGLRENGTTDADSGRSAVTINLPGALSAQQYARLIQPEQPKLEDDASERG